MTTATAPAAPATIAERVRRIRPHDSREAMVLRPEQKKLARELSPVGERKDQQSKRLAERYLRECYIPGTKLSERQRNKATMDQIGQVSTSRTIQEWDGGQLKVNGPDGISFEDFQNRVVYGANKISKTGSRLVESLKGIMSGRWDQRLAEHVVDGVGLSQYRRYIDDTLRLGTWEMCESVSVAPILSLIGRASVDCGQQTLVSDLVPVHVWKELRPMAENEDTPFFGVGRPSETKLPYRDKIKFAYAIKREAYCRGIDAALREVMMKGGEQLDRYWAPLIVQLILDYHANATDNRWPFVLNDQKWRAYYQVQANDTDRAAVPYENLVNSQTDLDRSGAAVFRALELVIEDMEDFQTGDPKECLSQPWDILALTPSSVEAIRYALADYRIEYSLGGTANPVLQQNRDGRTNKWNTAGMFANPWLRKYAREFLKILNPTWTRDEVTIAMDRTALVGNISAAYLLQDEWGKEEQDMPTAWTSFNEEVIWGRKFMWKAGLGTVDPQNVVYNRGYPDTAAPPAPSPTPIP